MVSLVGRTYVGSCREPTSFVLTISLSHVGTPKVVGCATVKATGCKNCGRQSCVQQVRLPPSYALTNATANSLSRHGTQQEETNVGPHHQRLLEVLAAALGHQRQLRREALHVVRLLGDERVRDEHGEIAVLVARLLKPFVQPALNALPDGVAPRLDHHRATHGSVVCVNAAVPHHHPCVRAENSSR
jgi:hypothetical protein